jgi:hypothetical protein
MRTAPRLAPLALSGFALFSLLLSSCATGSAPLGSSAASLEENSLEAFGLLEFLNQTDLVELDIDAALDKRAARNLMAFREGADGQMGTADDREFVSVAEVDAVKRIGPATLSKLVAYVESEGWVPKPWDLLGIYDGVHFTYAEAGLALALVNSASVSELKEQVKLASQAVNSIETARPIFTVRALADLYYVGPAMLGRIKTYVAGIALSELGIISDLDKTVIPPVASGLPSAAYPGVAALYTELELANNGTMGDMYYVTARSAAAVVDIPDWLEAHSLPSGPINSGISGLPWVARPEKVADIVEVMDANPGQHYLLFGDTSHVDPEVYHDIMDLYPDRISAAFVHHVKNISDARAEGLHVFQDYAQVAAILLSIGELSEAAARNVMNSAKTEGLAISDAEIEDLIATHLP